MGYKAAGFWYRFAAFYLNLLALLIYSTLIVTVIIYYKILDISILLPKFYILFAVVFGIVALIDSVIEGIWGVNLSKALLGLKLIDDKVDKPIGVFRSLMRSVLALFSLLFFAIGYIAAAFNIEGRTLHDLISTSRVVRVEAKGLKAFLNTLVFLFSSITGLVITLAVILSVTALPYLLAKSSMDLNQYSSQETQIFGANGDGMISIPIAHNRVFALTEFKRVEYIEFKLSKTSPYSYISEKTLKRLGVNLLDFDVYLLPADAQLDTVQERLRKAIIIPKLTLKDANDKDLVIHNQRFIVDLEKDVFGPDILALWDYQISAQDSKLYLALNKGDKAILANPDLSDITKNYLLYVARLLRASWDDYLLNLPVALMEEFMAETMPLINPMQLQFDPKSGYISQITLIEPSKNENFNKISEEFIRSQPRFRAIPAELKTQSLLPLEIELKYSEKL